MFQPIFDLFSFQPTAQGEGLELISSVTVVVKRSPTGAFQSRCVPQQLVWVS